MLSNALAQWVQETTQKTIVSVDAIGGGCINQAAKLSLSDGQAYFIKYHHNPPQRLFSTEFKGLEAIRKQVDMFVPNVVAHSNQAILMEYLEPISMCQKSWHQLGEYLASLHHQEFESYGFEEDNFCGLTPQKNSKLNNGHAFFAQYRLNYQAKLALDAALISDDMFKQIVQLSSNLENWIPDNPAVLIHGDLWSGNMMSTQTGVKLVDPACYYGWAEAELAMTLLFGGFDKAFYQSYEYHSGIQKDWRKRAPLYNLYHLLNHVNLFGQSYLLQVKQVLKSFIS